MCCNVAAPPAPPALIWMGWQRTLRRATRQSKQLQSPSLATDSQLQQHAPWQSR